MEARSGYRIIVRGAYSRTRRYSDLNETRGQNSKVTGVQVREDDHILYDNELRFEGKRLTWDQLAIEVGDDAIGRTMRNVLQSALDYENCMACVKG